MYVYVNLIALLLTVVAFGLFVAVALHGFAIDAKDERRYISALSWLWFAMALVVGVLSMRTVASPGEYAAVKVAYVSMIVLIGANAVLQLEPVGGDVKPALRKGAMWAAGMLAILLTAAAALRVLAWGRSSAQLIVVRNQYRATPGTDRVGVAERVLEMSQAPERRMKRMLRTLEKSMSRRRR